MILLTTDDLHQTNYVYIYIIYTYMKVEELHIYSFIKYILLLLL